MESLYYLCMLIGVAWLLLWAFLPEDSPRRTDWWWPFDMVEEPVPGQPTLPSGRSAARPRDRRAAAIAASPADTAGSRKRQATGAAASWRNRS